VFGFEMEVLVHVGVDQPGEAKGKWTTIMQLLLLWGIETFYVELVSRQAKRSQQQDMLMSQLSIVVNLMNRLRWLPWMGLLRFSFSGLFWWGHASVLVAMVTILLSGNLRAGNLSVKR
jgi:hypothetical protein